MSLKLNKIYLTDNESEEQKVEQITNYVKNGLKGLQKAKKPIKSLPNKQVPYDKIVQSQSLPMLMKYYNPELIDIHQLQNHPNYNSKVYKNGIYFGILENNCRCESGILLYSDGRIYEGEWINNQKSGKAVEYYPNGAVYKGTFKDGKKHGRGQFRWPNGEYYDGEYVDGLKHGSGMWSGVKGDQYMGEWSKGMPHGMGVHVWINGDRYEGQFFQSLKHGEGFEKFANHDSYSGSYQYGLPNGFGIYTWANGNIYKGEFLNGYRHGYGKWNSKNESYEGMYNNDKKQGEGIYRWKISKQVYRGEFKNDLRHGYGKLEYADGLASEGIWVNDELTNNNNNITLQKPSQLEMNDLQMQFKKKDQIGIYQDPLLFQMKDQYDAKSKDDQGTTLSNGNNTIRRKHEYMTIDESPKKFVTNRNRSKNFSEQVTRVRLPRIQDDLGNQSVDADRQLRELEQIHKRHLTKYKDVIKKQQRKRPWIPNGLKKNDKLLKLIK